jgi:hypothetical protein
MQAWVGSRIKGITDRVCNSDETCGVMLCMMPWWIHDDAFFLSGRLKNCIGYGVDHYNWRGMLVESLRVRVGLYAHHAVPVLTTDAFNETKKKGWIRNVTICMNVQDVIVLHRGVLCWQETLSHSWWLVKRGETWEELEARCSCCTSWSTWPHSAEYWCLRVLAAAAASLTLPWETAERAGLIRPVSMYSFMAQLPRL